MGYQLQGSGLSVVNLSGSGKLKMDVSKLMLTAETFIIMRENKLTGAKQMFIKNIDLKMKNENLRVQLENLLGGGFIGDMANKILTLIGEDFLYTHKDTLATAAKEAYKSIIRKILDLGKMNNSS